MHCLCVPLSAVVVDCKVNQGRCAVGVIRGEPHLPALFSGHVGRILRCILEIVSPFEEGEDTGIELNERMMYTRTHTHTGGCVGVTLTHTLDAECWRQWERKEKQQTQHVVH